MTEQKNLVIAIVLSLVILLGSQWLFQPQSDLPQPRQTAEQSQAGAPATSSAGDPTAPTIPGTGEPAAAQAPGASRTAAL